MRRVKSAQNQVEDLISTPEDLLKATRRMLDILPGLIDYDELKEVAGTTKMLVLTHLVAGQLAHISPTSEGYEVVMQMLADEIPGHWQQCIITNTADNYLKQRLSLKQRRILCSAVHYTAQFLLAFVDGTPIEKIEVIALSAVYG